MCSKCISNCIFLRKPIKPKRNFDPAKSICHFSAKLDSEIEASLALKRKEILSSIRVVVFGPGSGLEALHRDAVRDFLISKGCKCLYPEDVLKDSEVNPAIAEREMIYQSHLTFVILIGIGPASEFSLYLDDPYVAAKFRIFQERQYESKESFLNAILHTFAKVYKQHYLFGSQAELLVITTTCLEDYVNLRALIGFYRKD